MTKLSVNINKFGTLRNSRGGNNPDIIKAAEFAQMFGADGITVHPRPDERHVRYQDVRDIKRVITTEFNIEGNPKEQNLCVPKRNDDERFAWPPQAPQAKCRLRQRELAAVASLT